MATSKETSSLRIEPHHLHDKSLFKLNEVIDFLAQLIGKNSSQTATLTADVASLLAAANIIALPHASRAAYPAAADQEVFFWETDRRALYGSVETAPGTWGWVWIGGEMQDAWANLPAAADFGSNDTGFLFYATDRTAQYRWSGTAWIYREGTYRDVAANIPVGLGADDAGFLFYAIDWMVLWRWDGAAWAYQEGTYRDTLANIPGALGAGDVGFLFECTDYAHVLRWDGAAWGPGPGWDSSGYFDDFTVGPWTHIGTADTNGVDVTWVTGPKFDPKWGTTNRIRLANVWYAVASIAADGLSLVLTAAAPVAAGVQYAMAVGWSWCDGAGDDNVPGNPVTNLVASGVTWNNTIPALATSGAYRKMGPGAYTGATVAAVAPAIAGDTADESAHTHAPGTLAADNESAHTHDIDHDHGAVASGNNSAANTFPMGAGAANTVAQDPHTHSVDIPALGVTASGAGSAHGHTVSGASAAGSAHKHGAGTLANSLAGGDPVANLVIRPWFRK